MKPKPLSVFLATVPSCMVMVCCFLVNTNQSAEMEARSRLLLDPALVDSEDYSRDDSRCLRLFFGFQVCRKPVHKFLSVKVERPRTVIFKLGRIRLFKLLKKRERRLRKLLRQTFIVYFQEIQEGVLLLTSYLVGIRSFHRPIIPKYRYFGEPYIRLSSVSVIYISNL
jgi:hypothetical protein